MSLGEWFDLTTEPFLEFFFISEFDGVASTALIFENLRTKVNQRWKLGLEFVALDIPQRKPLNAL